MKAVLLNKHSLEIAKLAPKEESRYTLSAVNVTDGETMVTNGHYLIRVQHPNVKIENYPNVPGDAEAVECKGLLMPTKTALELLKSLPKERSIPILNHAKVGKDAEGNLRAVTTDLATSKPMTCKPITGQYPNVDAVMPREEPRFRIGVSADYLSKLLAIAATYRYNSSFVELEFWGADRAMRINAHDGETGQHFTAVLMPMRGDVKGKPFPYDPTPDPFKDVPEYDGSAPTPDDSLAAVEA